MADEKLVALLKSRRWKKWRESTLMTTLEDKHYLNRVNLIGADLRGADLSNALLCGADLISAKLISAKLIHADLICANLSNADLEGANLSDAGFPMAKLIHANLKGADLRGAKLSQADLSYANLRCAFVRSEIQLGIKWRLVWVLQNKGGRKQDLSGADLSRADLSRVNFSHANLSYSQSSAANFHAAVLLGADLSDAQLDYANLSNTNLSGANLSNADLREANLEGANLHGANCIGADLTKVVMTGACIYQWKFSSHSLEQVECDFVYLRPSQKERCPPSDSFKPGEFAEFLYGKAERSSDSKSPGNIIYYIGEFNMSKSKYNFEGPAQVGSVGDNNTVQDFTLQQANVGKQIDLKALAKELTKLREYLDEQDTPDEYATEVTAITKAESAAKKGDETTVQARLLKAGAWALELSKQIGAPVLTAYLQHQLGLPK
jgi:uncharacterized protein YjbI with pentapeptide repeats